MTMSDDFQFLVGHKILESKNDEGMYAIQLTDPPYEGMVFTFGEVKFPEQDEDGDTCTISFDYDVLDDNGVKYDVDEFEKYIGDFLIELIVYQLSKNEIVYKGGVDENRTDDIEQSDFE